MSRTCGVLLPIASLPSRQGIGCFSREAYAFVDFLEKAGQSLWQILPIGQTGYGDSPYQSFSTFAGNPYFIDLEELVKAGYLTEEDVKGADFGTDPEKIDYEKLYFHFYPVLRKAYENSPYALHPAEKYQGPAYDAKRKAFADFIEENEDWLPDYALYSAVKTKQGGKSYIEWDDDIRTRQPSAMARYTAELADEIREVQFQQFVFFDQWKKLKSYANSRGIRIVGDIPIYVAFDSADTWSHPELFEFDEKGYPTVVAGCPPDGFSATGQRWGNPIYRWDYHKKTGYAWWLKRLSACFNLYDVVRIDHFRGFDEYWAIPYGDPTAERGKWMPGPGIDLFQTVRKKLGKKEIIAEDLGFMTPSVIKLVKDSGYPGMKVLQFAFDSREESDYLPHNYRNNSVVYTGTHDNETMRGWYEHVNRRDRAFARRYLDIHSTKDIAWKFIRCAFMSVADTAIIPMQDYLNLGDEARINTPSTLGGNWVWRMKDGVCTEDLAGKMCLLAKTYGRKK